MKSDILIYIESAVSDDQLMFIDFFLPELLAQRLSALACAGTIYYSLPEGYQGKLSNHPQSFIRTGHDDVEFWKDIFSRTESEHLSKIHAESPFLDASVIQEMMDLHLNYLAEFTFSENLPSGHTCEIVSKELISAIPEFSEKTLPLSKVIKANINHFDIEIYYKDPDIRDKRISFLSNNKRDKKIMEQLYRLGNAFPAYSDIKGLIEANPDVLYIGPSYVEIELNGACDLECIFCFRGTLKQVHGAMDISLYKNIIEQMKLFENHYTICFGGSGEPLMHPSFYEIANIAQDDPLVDAVIIETNGIYADINYQNYIHSEGLKIKTIVNINAHNSEMYLALHGKDHFNQVQQNILGLYEAAKDRLYIQIMKINETEPFLDAYYDFWEKHKIPIILQKQNTFLGRIQDRRYSDLSPLERVPCWHLQRDLYITADGCISFCKQIVDSENASGFLTTDSLSSIWERKRQFFINDYKKKYPANPNCKSCDEWYTFNF